MILKLKNQIFAVPSSQSTQRKVDIDKIIIPNKVLLVKRGFKCFIGFKDHEKCKPLFITLPKIMVTQNVLINLNPCLF